MRLTALRDAKVATLDGKSLGRVHEVHCEKGRVVALTCGAASFLERLTGRKHGHLIPWESVLKISDGRIIVAPEPPKGTKRAASRSRPGTRRPSGRRSAR